MCIDILLGLYACELEALSIELHKSFYLIWLNLSDQMCFFFFTFSFSSILVPLYAAQFVIKWKQILERKSCSFRIYRYSKLIFVLYFSFFFFPNQFSFQCRSFKLNLHWEKKNRWTFHFLSHEMKINFIVNYNKRNKNVVHKKMRFFLL